METTTTKNSILEEAKALDLSEIKYKTEHEDFIDIELAKSGVIGFKSLDALNEFADKHGLEKGLFTTKNGQISVFSINVINFEPFDIYDYIDENRGDDFIEYGDDDRINQEKDFSIEDMSGFVDDEDEALKNLLSLIQAFDCDFTAIENEIAKLKSEGYADEDFKEFEAYISRKKEMFEGFKNLKEDEILVLEADCHPHAINKKEIEMGFYDAEDSISYNYGVVL